MSDTSGKSKGGFHIGNVGGSVKVKAVGDVVAGDKTTTTTTTTIERGFAGDEQKQQFQSEIDQLREALRVMKTEIEASASLQQDKKDEVISDILEQIKALKQVKEETAVVPTGKPAPAEIATKVEGALDRAAGIVDKLQGVASKSVEIAETVGKFAVKYGPLILSARHLFGLP
jgi:hypothetical protein